METTSSTTLRPLLIIRPSSGWSALNLPEVWQFRDLLWSLAGRDLKLRDHSGKLEHVCPLGDEGVREMPDLRIVVHADGLDEILREAPLP